MQIISKKVLSQLQEQNFFQYPIIKARRRKRREGVMGGFDEVRLAIDFSQRDGEL